MATPAPPARAAALLLDIEGTTTSITFVKDVLFPYATENAAKFLETSWDETNVQEAVEGMRQQATKDVDSKVDGAVSIPDKDTSKDALIDAVSKSLKWLISIDSKNTYMKQLSGFIWQKGYEEGHLKGHVYDDVLVAFQRWKDAGLKLYIYSSGSVNAQKLLMKYSTAGDLQPKIDDYFDTQIGHKREASSYKNILEKISINPEDLIFFTDIAEEADAANESGVNIILLSREGNAPLSTEAKEKYHVVESFGGLEFSAAPVKRKQQSVEEDKDLPPAKIAKTTDDSVEIKNTEIESNIAAETCAKEDSAMEVDVETVKEADKVEIKTNGTSSNDTEESATASENQLEKKETVVVIAESAIVTEDKAMEVEDSENIKKSSLEEIKPAENSQCDSNKELMETENKPEESKTDDVLVSDKDKVPQNMETESKTAKIDTMAKTEEKVEVVSEKTDPKDVEEVKNNDVPKTNDVTEINSSELESPKKAAKTIESLEDKKCVDKEITEKIDEKPIVADSPVDVISTETVLPPILEESSEIDIMVTDENIVETEVIPVISNDDVDDAKLNEFLGEECEALEKECKAILSKAEKVMNTENATEKVEVAKSQPEPAVDVEKTNGHKTIVDELVSSATNEVIKEILPELPPTEKIETAAEATEKTTIATDNISSDKETTENASIKATNGKPETNGDSTKANGKKDEIEPELNGQNSDHKEKTNGASIESPDLVDKEIVVKKLATGDKIVEQLVET